MGDYFFYHISFNLPTLFCIKDCSILPLKAIFGYAIENDCFENLGLSSE